MCAELKMSESKQQYMFNLFFVLQHEQVWTVSFLNFSICISANMLLINCVIHLFLCVISVES